MYDQIPKMMTRVEITILSMYVTFEDILVTLQVCSANTWLTELGIAKHLAQLSYLYSPSLY